MCVAMPRFNIFDCSLIKHLSIFEIYYSKYRRFFGAFAWLFML